MTEWLKVHAWKACVRQRTAGSNPALSASRLIKFDSRVLHNKDSRIPPGPEGSNGSDFLCVLQGARLSFFNGPGWPISGVINYSTYYDVLLSNFFLGYRSPRPVKYVGWLSSTSSYSWGKTWQVFARSEATRQSPGINSSNLLPAKLLRLLHFVRNDSFYGWNLVVIRL